MSEAPGTSNRYNKLYEYLKKNEIMEKIERLKARILEKERLYKRSIRITAKYYDEIKKMNKRLEFLLMLKNGI